MKALFTVLANPLVIIGLWCVFFWALLRSPALRWTMKVALLLAWGMMTVGAVLFVVFFIYIPRGDYGAAVGAFLVGSLICFLWVVMGVPELLKTLRSAKGGLKLWERG